VSVLRRAADFVLNGSPWRENRVLRKISAVSGPHQVWTAIRPKFRRSGLRVSCYGTGIGILLRLKKIYCHRLPGLLAATWLINGLAIDGGLADFY